MAQDMALVSSLQDLEKRTLSSLDETLDYFTYSKRVWVILQKDVKKGRRFTFRSQTTKNQINEHDLLARAQIYVTGYLLSSTLQHFTSLFESYFFELLRVWLVSHPKSLSGKQVKFETVLTTNKAEIIQSVIDRELNDVKYKGDCRVV